MEKEVNTLSLEIMLVVLVGSALHAIWNTLVKSGSDILLDMVLVTTGIAGVTALVVFFLPLPRSDSWGCLAISVLIHQAYFGSLMLAYRGADLSLVYPIMRGTAPVLITLIAAVMLDEQPSWGGCAGILLVSIGVLVLAANASPSKGARLAPVAFALLNAGVIAAGTLVDGYGARLSGNAFSYTGWVLLLTAILIFVGATAWRCGLVIRHIRGGWKKGIIGGGCTYASYALALWAMTHAPIALVAALRESSIVFTGVAALFVLREKFSAWRYVSISMITAGAVAIKVF
jgi:drug/metabolite transporter (DMT)-like permease